MTVIAQLKMNITNVCFAFEFELASLICPTLDLLKIITIILFRKTNYLFDYCYT